MESNAYNLFDQIVMATFTNLYSNTKEKEENWIKLNNFNFKNIKHLYLLNIALYLQTVCNTTIYLHCPWWKFWWYKICNWRDMKLVKRAKDNSKGINLEELMMFMANGFEQTVDIFDDIYNAYYTKKGR